MTTDGQYNDREALDSFLGFAAGVLTAREKVQLTMSQSRLGVFRESEIAALPGVSILSEDGDWLRLRRLDETRPNDPLGYVALFMDGAATDPERIPELAPAVAVTVPIEEASDLEEARLLRHENVHQILEKGLVRDDVVRVTLFAEDCREVRRGFEDWLKAVWLPWADAERPVRRSIKLYNSLFKLHSTIHSAESTPPEVIWGLGLATWENDGEVVDMPIVEQAVEIDVERGGDIVVLPRELPPTLSLKPFLQLEIPGSDRLQATLHDLLRDLLAGDAEIDPGHLETIEPLLSTAVVQLDPRHVSKADRAAGAEIPSPSSDLKVCSAWAIYGRPRSLEARAQDIAAVRRQHP